MNLHLCRLTVHLTGAAMWRRTPLWFEIVRRARRSGIAGASVFEGEPLPHTRRSRATMLRPNGWLPLTVVVVDEEEKVRQLLEDLSGTLDGTVATLDFPERIPTGH
ncbi:hypothetical protein ADK55_17430 [Streptomyces sp. WM4235]|uniref:DUF190 domain-containing protein n=1 Tax=Streptomyces sp. WM4235 TaxID=1415551 RepID=UPI0006B0688A|nr:DUF190 domain-containing protein [Streptomyces sp. WM4235]KOU52235.1 hypothetical protein ADK55_17430 [Streptomyces sp. WM4235]